MSSIIFFLFFIPILSIILLSVNFIFAPHKPYKEKKTPFECGYHSFSQTRSQFSISFFLFAYVFLLLDIEIILIYPYPLSAVDNTIYGLSGMIVFTTIVTVGFVFELGKEALKITSKQYEEFPPNPYGFLSVEKPSMIPCDPFICDELTEDQNMQAIEELSHYLTWAIDWFHETIIKHDFVMIPIVNPNGPHPESRAFFEYNDTLGVVPQFMPPCDSPMWADKSFSGLSGKYLWLSHYKNNSMGIPNINFYYRLIRSVYIDVAVGLDHEWAPSLEWTRNWTCMEDKIDFNTNGIHEVSMFYEIIRSTLQNICAHIKHGYKLIEQWKAMDTQSFLLMMGYEEDINDTSWIPTKVDLLSIMHKQGYDPVDDRSKEILKNIGDNATGKEIKKTWIQFNFNLLQDQEKLTIRKCKLINNSVILSELAKERMFENNLDLYNYPTIPRVERLVQFTAPSMSTNLVDNSDNPVSNPLYMNPSTIIRLFGNPTGTNNYVLPSGYTMHNYSLYHPTNNQVMDTTGVMSTMNPVVTSPSDVTHSNYVGAPNYSSATNTNFIGPSTLLGPSPFK